MNQLFTNVFQLKTLINIFSNPFQIHSISNLPLTIFGLIIFEHNHEPSRKNMISKTLKCIFHNYGINKKGIYIAPLKKEHICDK